MTAKMELNERDLELLIMATMALENRLKKLLDAASELMSDEVTALLTSQRGHNMELGRRLRATLDKVRYGSESR